MEIAPTLEVPSDQYTSTEMPSDNHFIFVYVSNLIDTVSGEGG